MRSKNRDIVAVRNLDSRVEGSAVRRGQTKYRKKPWVAVRFHQHLRESAVALNYNKQTTNNRKYDQLLPFRGFKNPKN